MLSFDLPSTALILYSGMLIRSWKTMKGTRRAEHKRKVQKRPGGESAMPNQVNGFWDFLVLHRESNSGLGMATSFQVRYLCMNVM